MTDLRHLAHIGQHLRGAGATRRPQQILCDTHRQVARRHVVDAGVHRDLVQDTDHVTQVDQVTCRQRVQQPATTTSPIVISGMPRVRRSRDAGRPRDSQAARPATWTHHNTNAEKYTGRLSFRQSFKPKITLTSVLCVTFSNLNAKRT